MGEALSASAQSPEISGDVDPEMRAEQIRVQLEAALEHTSLEDFQKETGYGVEELTQWTVVMTPKGPKEGILAMALIDDECPYGGWVRGAFAKEGLQGVEEFNDFLRKQDPGLDIKISQQARQREQARLLDQVKKK